MSTPFPLWVIAIDYVLGVIMWTLIGRSAMGLFQPENSNFFFMVRFYLMPWLLGYSVMGMLSFPLEGEIAAGIWQLFSPLVR